MELANKYDIKILSALVNCILEDVARISSISVQNQPHSNSLNLEIRFSEIGQNEYFELLKTLENRNKNIVYNTKESCNEKN